MREHAERTRTSQASADLRQKALLPGCAWRYSALEGLLSFTLLFGVTTIVRWLVGPSSLSIKIGDGRLSFLTVGVTVGLLISALILSRPGRISGGHMNPAISVAMWRFGIFPGRLVIPYVVAQFAGSVAGVIVARLVWGTTTEEPPVSYAVIHPAAGWTATWLFAAEAATTGIVIYAVGYFLQSPRLAPLVPWLAGILIGAAIALLGNVTGASMNPVRQFGPALLSAEYSFLWVYLAAPMAGALVAALLLGVTRRRRAVLTHRLCGTQEDGSAVPISHAA
ncbi:aquaporin (plasmid) [Streptomyces sp. NBC_00015]|uniref:MIP/aquaporin family protein n=1 Tax=unclassified Streptomyces TaxID=2593676 RepID=UPI002F917F0C